MIIKMTGQRLIFFVLKGAHTVRTQDAEQTQVTGRKVFRELDPNLREQKVYLEING